jgi:hypothetical protein
LRRSLLVPLVVLALALATSGTALADPDGNQAGGVTDPGLLALIGNDDVFSTADLSLLLAPAMPMGPSGQATQHYGPYSSTSPDSSTCGNDWATDTFDRHFTVKTNNDGTFTVIEQFKQGSFITMAGFSPGGCENGPPEGTVDANKTGSMHGYFIIPLPVGAMQISHDPGCEPGSPPANCTTYGFLNSHFTGCVSYPSAVCGVTTYFFHFSASDQGLIEHEWKNASADRGGNHGDIRSANFP